MVGSSKNVGGSEQSATHQQKQKVRPRGPCCPLVGCSEPSWTRVRYIGQSMPWREDRGRYCAACLPLKEDDERSRLRARVVTMSAG